MTNLQSPKNKSHGRRTRALGACKTCRKRHVKCDQRRPICKACSETDLMCEGLASEIQWVGSSSSLGHGVSSGPNVRRHLYTEKERQFMSSALVSEVASYSIDQHLADIDTQSKDLEEQNKGDICLGPFSVLKLTNDTTQSAAIGAPNLECELVCNLDMSDEPPILATAPFPEPSTAEDLLGNLDNYLQWADVFSLDPIPVELVFTPPLSEHGTHPAEWFSPNELQGSPIHAQGASQISDALSEAPFLLRHFQNHVVTRIIWLPMTQKSPWRIMNTPFAMITFDQLTYMNQSNIKSAGLANLYAILACASYHLVKNPEFALDKPGMNWENIAKTTYAEAKQHMNMSYANELRGTHKAKYKEQLMAMLSLTTFAILSDNQREARCHIINMEYLITLRGLVKPCLSRRARLLHHMYTWIRILTESTLVIHNAIPHTAPCKELWSRGLDTEEINRLTQRRATVAAYDQSGRLDDFLFLPVTQSESDRDLNIDDPKDSQVNLGDIHLVDSRKVPDELHTVVNGVSETWLGLLSQTTRLANVMDQLNSRTCSTNTNQLLALHRRSLYLENMICSFTSRKPPSQGGPEAYMLQALNSALIIYFYRRVRQVNPYILQGYVTQIIEELHKWDEALVQHQLLGPGTAWPAFMAGCEALGQREQLELSQWLNKAALQSGFSSYSTARSVMEEVWKRRDSRFGGVDSSESQSRGPVSFSWTDLSKQNLHWLLLC